MIGEASDDSASFRAFNLDQGAPPAHPVLVSVPHAGRAYPAALLDNLAVPADALLRLEDRYADRLAGAAIAAGLPCLIADAPRAWIDLNRRPDELDSAMIEGVEPGDLPSPSRKVRGGLGLVPRRLAGHGNLWSRPWASADIAARIATVHTPYHARIEAVLAAMSERFGAAVLLDLHSMPPLTAEQGEGAIVIGDAFARTAGARYTRTLTDTCTRAGFRTRVNHPYAGGHILRRHGDPGAGRHALQLEISRALYLDAAALEPSKGMPRIAELVARAARALTDRVLSRGTLIAAE